MPHEADLEAFKFVDKLSINISSDTTEKKEKAPDLKGIGTIITLGEVSNFGIEEFDEDTYLTKSKFRDVEGKMVGLAPAEYAEFKNFVLKIFDTTYFSNCCDFSTLLDASFEWLFEVYKSKQAKTNLTSFLIDKIQSLTQEHHFYFHLKAVAIENVFTVGNTEIRFFKDEEIQRHYNSFREKKPETSFEEFNSLYHFDAIYAVVKIRGVIRRASEIALREAELSVDVLKCFCSHYSAEKFVQMFDIDYRFHAGSSTTYFDLPNGNIVDSTLHVINLGGRIPIELTNKVIKAAETRGLKSFSEFIKHKQETELYYTTIDLIKQLSSIASTHDNYDKVVKSISLFESVCVPKNASKAKGETILRKKVTPKLSLSDTDKENFNRLVRQFYEVRDKYLHNYVQLPISKKDLAAFLDYQRIFILNVIRLNKHYKTVLELLAYFQVE